MIFCMLVAFNSGKSAVVKKATGNKFKMAASRHLEFLFLGHKYANQIFFTKFGTQVTEQ